MIQLSVANLRPAATHGNPYIVKMSLKSPSDQAKSKGLPPPTYHHGDVREALVQAGIEILEERGLAALTLRETARRAGVSHAAPYHHFSDKGALLTAIAARGFRMQHNAMAAAAQSTTDPGEGLQAYGLNYVSFAQNHPSLFRLMYTRECGPNTPPELAEASSGFYPKMVEGICAATGCSVEQASSISLLLWSTMHGLAMLWLDHQLLWEGHPPLDKLAYELSELLGRILQSPNPAP